MVLNPRLSKFGSLLLCAGSVIGPLTSSAQSIKSFPIAEGWAKNQINTVIFRRNSIISHNGLQYAAFYDEQSRVVLASRKLANNKWEINPTQYTGDTSDAHKSISIGVDGAGYIHVVWNQHDSKLQYCRSRLSGSLELTEPMPMIGDRENRVTYPEFYNLAGGDLLFLYRDGSSGRGNLVINRYHPETGKWLRVHNNLIDGENTRSAYWQATVDVRGSIHISWVWRETPDVASNHDVCYAKSVDGGKTWLNSSGDKYKLPITARSAEYVAHIPQGSDLINQTSMTTDSRGRVYIATYWRSARSDIPQYRVIYQSGRQWRISQVTQRTTAFTLQGRGTRRIPISRPLVLASGVANRVKVLVVFRDEERGDRISLASSDNLSTQDWKISDLTATAVGMWEPTFDPLAWQKRKELHLFVQNVGQGQGETLENLPPQLVSVLVVDFKNQYKRQ